MGVKLNDKFCSDYEKERLLELIKRDAYKQGEFTLSSGKKSKHYFNTKTVTFSPEGAFLVAKVFMEKIFSDDFSHNIDAVGGLEIGTIPITGSLSVLCYESGLDISFFVVRKKTKGHGERNLVEGANLDKIKSVIVIEDVITTGQSARKAVDSALELGWEVKKVITLIDREEGAVEMFKEAGVPFEPIFKMKDFKV